MPPMFPFMIDIKSTIIAALLVVVFVLATCKSCVQSRYDKLKAECGDKKTVVVTKHDTTIGKDVIQVVEHAPIPYQSTQTLIKYKIVHDSIFAVTPISTDTIFVDTLINKWYIANYYKKTFTTKYGTITAFDTVSKNSLVGMSILTDLQIPTVTNTVYNNNNRNVLYFGIDIMGNNGGINGAGANLLYKTKKSIAYELGASFGAGSQVNYRVGLHFPITFKKQ